MNIDQIINNNHKRVNLITGYSYVSLSLCRVDKVNVDQFTLDVQMIDSGKILTAVPFCLPTRFFDRGFLCLPEKGAIGVLATTENQEAFVISFISFARLSEINEDVLPGELLLQSKGYAFIKADNAGNVVLGTPAGNMFIVGGNGETTLTAATAKSVTVAKTATSGLVNGAVADIERVFDREATCALPAEEIAQHVLSGTAVPLTKPLPVVIIEKGNAIGAAGERLKLELETNASLNRELCYRISVQDEAGNSVFSLGIDKQGNTMITGRKVVIDADVFDFSRCRQKIT